jgi:hypothetical protein
MDLRQHLKQARARPKEPFSRTAFTVVAALVRKHNLDENFVARLKDFSLPGAEWLRSCEFQIKRPFEPPLFPLVSEPEYRLVQEILSAADSPYLRFAQCPEELLLAKQLCRLNPELDPSVLARAHFRTLLAREIVRHEIQALGRLPAAGDDSQGQLAVCESLLQRLNALIDQSMLGNTI